MEGNINGTYSLAGEISGEGGGGVTPHVTATAQVDANTGTPTVTVTRTGTDENPNFNFAFQNLKGETGAQGIQGIQGLPGSQGIPGERGPRGFTGNTGETGPQGEPGESPVVSATASIDSSIGTPSVSVTKTGPELSPNFAFSFHNLKGEPGADSTVPGPEGPEGPVGPAGAGLAAGGSVGQILYKNGADDYLTDWEDLTADIVEYDNTNSGLTATDAQGAIDEINSSLTNLLKVKSYTHSYTVSANGNVNWSPFSDDNISIAGYTAVGIITFMTNNTSVFPLNMGFDNGTWSIALKNTSNASVSADFKYTVLYIKTGMYS